jgi:hypothetical protein
MHSKRAAQLFLHAWLHMLIVSNAAHAIISNLFRHATSVAAALPMRRCWCCSLLLLQEPSFQQLGVSADAEGLQQHDSRDYRVQLFSQLPSVSAASSGAAITAA